MPKTAKKTASELTTIAARAVRTRRRKHPGGSTDPLCADDVQKAFANRKTFTTGDIMREFGAAKDNVTAVAAVLRSRKLTEKTGVASDGTSSWRWV
jgi:hypothetical protein